MRLMEFKMERPDLCKKGAFIKVKEYELPQSYYYTLDHAIGMSKNYPEKERLKSKEGKVLEIKETQRGFYIVMEFDE